MFYHMIFHLTYLFTHYNRSHHAYFNSQIYNIDHKIEFGKHSIFLLGGTFEKITKQESILVGCVPPYCHAMKTKGMVFRYTWVYSKEDTMAHTRRPVVTS